MRFPLTSVMQSRPVLYMGLKTLVISALLATSAFAQDIAGTWQGTLQTPQRAIRLVMKVTRAADESLKAMFYSIDQNGQALPGNAVAFQGTVFKAAIPAVGGQYEGKLSADGNTINGTLTQGSPQILNLVRATPSTEWAIPEPPPPPRVMAADAKPSFEVATIKPSNPDTPGRALNIGRGGGNAFTTLNMPLFDLIKFAYGVHGKQVTGAPSWVESDRYDILAKPDTQGIPNADQVRSMVQKLLAERFGLEFHREKKELSAYVITVDKAGLKIAKVEGNRGNLPGFGGRGPGAMGARNTTMAEFADFLQARILERPVVDQTGLTDRYDFTLEWRPDDAQLAAAAGPNPPALPQNIEDRPDLLTAMRQQLGLKIESSKANVEVLVIDKVTKPTAN
jgi:uncharacterized protein (TIGR03435 family)